jgi:hypothetical protein
MHRAALCLVALLCIGSASAQSLYKPRNTLTLPLAEPLDIELHLKDEALGYRDYIATGTGLSPIGDALAAARMRSKEDEIIRPALARIQAGMTNAPRAEMLASAIRAELEATGKVTIGTIRIHDSGLPLPGVQPGDEARNVLLLVCHYEMDALFQGFVVGMYARYGTRAEILASGRKQNLPFLQSLEYRETTPRGGFLSFAEDAARYWEGIGPEAIDRRIDSGLRDVAAMLAYELQHKPKFGRIAGKQFGIGKQYAAIETERGDRAWLRVRNGQLASLPLSEVR